jgi:DNA invertase Pin-like site-specific DNA recombinase
VETKQIDGLLCTWYDRLTRSRDFYVLDKEFKTHRVDLIMLHDPTDRHSASGRFMETLWSQPRPMSASRPAKSSHQDADARRKGLWNGGPVPFGFKRDEETKILCPTTK